MSSKQTSLRRMMKLCREKKKASSIQEKSSEGGSSDREDLQSFNSKHSNTRERQVGMKSILKPSRHGPIPSTATEKDEEKKEHGDASALAGLMDGYSDSEESNSVTHNDDSEANDKVSASLENNGAQSEISVNFEATGDRKRKRVAFGKVETKFIPKVTAMDTTYTFPIHNPDDEVNDVVSTEDLTTQQTAQDRIADIDSQPNVREDETEIQNNDDNIDPETLKEFEELLNDDHQIENEETSKITDHPKKEQTSKKKKKKKGSKKKRENKESIENSVADQFTSEVEQVAYEARLAKLMLLGRHKKRKGNETDDDGKKVSAAYSIDYSPNLAFHEEDEDNVNGDHDGFGEKSNETNGNGSLLNPLSHNEETTTNHGDDDIIHQNGIDSGNRNEKMEIFGKREEDRQKSGTSSHFDKVLTSSSASSMMSILRKKRAKAKQLSQLNDAIEDFEDDGYWKS